MCFNCVHQIVPSAQFELTTPSDGVHMYQPTKQSPRFLFCSTCGMDGSWRSIFTTPSPFSRDLTNLLLVTTIVYAGVHLCHFRATRSDLVAVNVGCLSDTLAPYKVYDFSGHRQADHAFSCVATPSTDTNGELVRKCNHATRFRVGFNQHAGAGNGAVPRPLRPWPRVDAVQALSHPMTATGVLRGNNHLVAGNSFGNNGHHTGTANNDGNTSVTAFHHVSHIMLVVLSSRVMEMTHHALHPLPCSSHCRHSRGIQSPPTSRLPRTRWA